MSSSKSKTPLSFYLISGGMAGITVDFCLYPLDTFKTRIQSKAGFFASGGFKGMYSGLASTLIGSVPSAACFFFSYEILKRSLSLIHPESPAYRIHMFSACLAEVSACIIRVPTEILKQRLQTNQYSSTWMALQVMYQTEGILGFYRGYLSTVVREIPFTIIQFPLYESLKSNYTKKLIDREIYPYEAAVCGSIAGATAASITTPFDVVKTRIMLSSSHSLHQYHGVRQTFLKILKEDGVSGLFKGLVPRVVWVGVGGFIFFGVYEGTKSMLNYPYKNRN